MPDGKAFAAGSQLQIRTGRGPDGGRALFAFTSNEQIARMYGPGEPTHLLAGTDVAAAGEIVVRDGKIELLTDRSGHYMPSRSLTQQMLDQLADQGIVIDPENIQYFAPPEPQ